ncbi:TetR/AcrR family transcriptional regulator [Amycolatopsis anabasis]|uniref:TetR/AcrR family transcriptional regulator n=1 Tax=Amycolatopsis anabasis TaxID=1840409 RepID=UPI00131DC556|nr:TetR/AcrR family transcriptional regulator [Amycolatopsis anabasis]
MATTDRPKRPGGRSARVRSAVLRAVEELLVDGGIAALSVAAVAERAGVNPSSVYRRWGTLDALLFDAVLAATARTVPTANTGSLRGDLERFVQSSIRATQTPLGAALAQVLLTRPLTPEGQRERQQYWARRHEALRPIFDRARERGERVPDPEDVIETVLAPVYFRRFVTGRPISRKLAATLVDRTLAGSPHS